MINNILLLAYEILFYLLLITSIKILLYISWVSGIQLKKIEICGGPRDSVKSTRSSWSVNVCPGLSTRLMTSPVRLAQRPLIMFGFYFTSP
jgi:hypothetical protein